MVITVSFAGTLCGLGLVLYVCYLRRKSKAQLYGKCSEIEVVKLNSFPGEGTSNLSPEESDLRSLNPGS